MPAPAPRRILLADADAFFVAVARLADPDGAGRAPLLIVGGSAEQRGVVTSASYEVRKFGVRSGMPMARAKRLCPQATVVPVPRGLCSAKSREIRRVLERFAPVVAPASIDEWYLDLGGTEALYGHEPLAATAHRIRDAVIAGTGLSVSFGGGTSRLVAKLAVERAKPKPGSGADGVHVVAPGDEPAFLQTVELAELPGVGPRLQERLRRHGLVTVPDALACDHAALVRATGSERTASWLQQRVRGIDDSPVQPRGEAKSISRDETFARDLHDDADFARELWRLVVRAAGDLRRSGYRARTVTVRVRDADFTTRQASRTLPEAIETERAIGQVAEALLARLRRARRVGARLLGVSLSGFGGAEPPAQLALFGAGEPPLETARDRAVTRALEAVRARFGADGVMPGKLVGRPGRKRP
ncbi:MAG TPA: DNA polymerase IV [Gemmatimonadaceae bacterium]|nr:DNA polymerase IV [Gemmatimonadaceae bacterium]